LGGPHIVHLLLRKCVKEGMGQGDREERRKVHKTISLELFINSLLFEA